MTIVKLQFAQTQFRCLGHLISEQGLNLDPDRLYGILSFPKPKTKHQLRGLLRLVSYCQNWDSKFLSYGQTSICFTQQ